MNDSKLEALYGPIGKDGWDRLELEINRLMDEAGLKGIERYSTGFNVDFETGEVTMIPPRS